MTRPWPDRGTGRDHKLIHHGNGGPGETLRPGGRAQNQGLANTSAAPRYTPWPQGHYRHQGRAHHQRFEGARQQCAGPGRRGDATFGRSGCGHHWQAVATNTPVLPQTLSTGHPEILGHNRDTGGSSSGTGPPSPPTCATAASAPTPAAPSATLPECAGLSA